MNAKQRRLRHIDYLDIELHARFAAGNPRTDDDHL